MTRIAAFMTALVLAAPVFASTDGLVDKATQEKITADLTAQGYDVRKIQMEDGMVEVYAMKDGKKLELYLDATGKVVTTKSAD